MKKALLFIITVICCLSITAQAAQQRQPKRPGVKAPECRIISKGSAMRAVASRTNGKVVSAFLTGGRPPVYRVKTLSKSGRVKSVSVNACNGRVYG